MPGNQPDARVGKSGEGRWKVSRLTLGDLRACREETCYRRSDLPVELFRDWVPRKQGDTGKGGTGAGAYEKQQAFTASNEERALAQNLMKRVCNLASLNLVHNYVKANNGPPGIDGITVDELKELEKRGHRFCRYADDCNIYVRSKAAGERVMVSITQYLEGRLRLRVKRRKTTVPMYRSGISWIPSSRRGTLIGSASELGAGQRSNPGNHMKEQSHTIWKSGQETQ